LVFHLIGALSELGIFCVGASHEQAEAREMAGEIRKVW
jgi:hypothetical protein